MRVVTVSDVLSWKPDVSARGGWPESSQSHLSSDKTYMGKASDLRDYSTSVYIVRIKNFYGDVIESFRVAGSDRDVQNVADEMLNTFCRRFPGSPLSYQMHRFVEEEL